MYDQYQLFCIATAIEEHYGQCIREDRDKPNVEYVLYLNNAYRRVAAQGESYNG